MKAIILNVVVWMAIVACGFWSVSHFLTQPAIAFGLPLGLLLGPTRVAAVDFRQWFRDPGEPLHAGDDSPFGLMRNVFHGAFPPTVLAIVAGSCWFGYTVGGIEFRLLHVLKVIGEIFVGIVPVQAAVELTWRFGLAVLPKPVSPARFLAHNRTPAIRAWPEPSPARRRLIVCCDGTWNWPDGVLETNVIRLVRAIAPVDNGVSQIVYYHPGVGTGNILDRIAGGGAGVGLSLSVKACYGFIIDNYEKGDEIFLFGFSRGAFIARSVAGMIGTVGLLRKADMEKFIQVWDWYAQAKGDRNERELDDLVTGGREAVPIQCVGVWDTVGALGIPGSRFCVQSYAFYETELGDHVRYAFQALAIDERRGNFQAAVWVPPLPQAAHGAAAQAAARAVGAVDREQVLEQVWFPGVHSNVGGGYAQHGLSDTALLWMLAQLKSCELLGLDDAYVASVLDGAEPYPTGSLPNSRTMFWRLIGSPVPRPVCIINATEQVHESAWDRAAWKPRPAPRNEIYRRAARQRWLNARMNAKVDRSPDEKISPATPPGGPIAVPRRVTIPKNIGFCGRLLRLVGGSG